MVRIKHVNKSKISLHDVCVIRFSVSGALSGKMLLVMIVENDKIYAYFMASYVK